MFRKSTALFALILFYVHSTILFAAPLSLDINAESAILINADSGVILYEKQARTPHYPASTTKIATAVYALKLKGDALDTMITAQPDAQTFTTEEARRKSNYTIPAYWLVSDGSMAGIKKRRR